MTRAAEHSSDITAEPHNTRRFFHDVLGKSGRTPDDLDPTLGTPKQQANTLAGLKNDAGNLCAGMHCPHSMYSLGQAVANAAAVAALAKDTAGFLRMISPQYRGARFGQSSTRSLTEMMADALARGLACPNSFPAGTLVLMSDGRTKAIEDIELGDEVLATDPETGETAAKKVDAALITPDDREFTTVTLDGDGSTVTATDHHPFWAANRGAWIDASDLKVGDTVRAADGTLARVAATAHMVAPMPAYNLTVRDIHTYYVLGGTTPVLVHNSGCGPSGGGTIFSHFTDAAGAQGISGADVSGMSVGQTIEVRSVQFGQGSNQFMATGSGDMFVTDLGPDATSGQLGRVGVFGDRQNYVIQFSQEAAFDHGVRPVMNPGSNSIFTIPGGSQFSGGYTYTVTRVR
ncbi:polymorphic toxin-type HINT domain-containing protein [Kitasatospora griseola]|uniref:polymorphic toxin-type HINT domain-containing protein n=1 Tax=Kitasatospora griseola TaxID=2064 RepID=UPI0037FC8C17